MKRVLALLLFVVTACASSSSDPQSKGGDAPLCKRFVFTTAAPEVHPPRERLRLAVIGDAGDAAERANPEVKPRELAEAIASQGSFDAILVLGDNFYPCGISRADADAKFVTVYGALFELGIPLYPVLGNHDYGDGSSKCNSAVVEPDAQVEYRGGTWRMPARNYVVRWPGLATIAMLDTEPVKLQCSGSNAVLDFVRESLTTEDPWKLAAGHHVVESHGPHGLQPSDGGRMRTLLAPVLKTQAADLYLSGHDHHLEISRSRKPMYVVSGAASRRRSVIGGDAYRRHGFAIVELTAKKMTVSLVELRTRKLLHAVTVER
ncbi:MAG TPA: metallophosphoesterase [Thermoanaerobaculia bacterium]